ncbi:MULTISPECIES: hypothetical protein [Vibrio harveyi group]|uniref:hypothetical protein n=1 Tax=Vibrio harveyi group TaxID=717610 RepID=UPI0021608C23|nr:MULTISPECIES: hypothetical protein [Vibrio harveyi group]MCS0435132.1 hypothetical protein [Vibrio diabolicus]
MNDINLPEIVKKISTRNELHEETVARITKATIRAWRKHSIGVGHRLGRKSEVSEIAKRTRSSRKVVATVLVDLRKYRTQIVELGYNSIKPLGSDEGVFVKRYDRRSKAKWGRARHAKQFPHLSHGEGERDDPGPFVMPQDVDPLKKE